MRVTSILGAFAVFIRRVLAVLAPFVLLTRRPPRARSASAGTGGRGAPLRSSGTLGRAGVRPAAGARRRSDIRILLRANDTLIDRFGLRQREGYYAYGAPIGKLGSSGNWTEPHPHFQLCNAPDPRACAGIAVEFQDVSLPYADYPRPVQSGDSVVAKERCRRVARRAAR